MKVLTASQIRTAEENAVLSGIFSFADLMLTAGTKAAEIITSRYDIKNKKITIVSGSGNNGGDGLVIADILSGLGAEVTVVMPIGSSKTDTAKIYLKRLSFVNITDTFPPQCDILIDALFGIALDREITGKAADIIDLMNLSSAEKIAIDIPSGVFADTGRHTKAFKADLTITFIALKPCFLLPPASELCGEVLVADIGVKPKKYSYLTVSEPKPVKRPKNSHKGTFGTAALLTGSYGMSGAQILSAKAAIRSGVGLAKTIVCDKNYSAFCASVPEAVTIPVKTHESGAPHADAAALKRLISGSDALAIGCGLGQNEDIKRLVTTVLLNTNIPTVIDADGINAVSRDISIIEKIKAPVILTPHPAEMARLIGKDVAFVEADRVGTARGFAEKYGCILVLKGANTIIAAPDDRVFFNTTGNPGMATAGSGDVLTGIIVSLLAQGESPLSAALSGVWLHGKAGDLAAKMQSLSSVSAGDIIDGLKNLNC